MGWLTNFRNALLWPPFIVLFLYGVASLALPHRYLLFSGDGGQIVSGILFALVALSIVSFFVPSLAHAQRPLAFALTIVASLCAIGYFVQIIGRIAIGGSDLKGNLLLQAAILIWVMLVLTFALWYWLIDDGRDFFFPQKDNSDFPGWKPNFVDYVFLGFTTSTAFSPTDVLPASRRAKMLVMAQSSLSLATVAIVAARAVNVLT
ncbi:MAG TPA: DUF1345 domain-containing protein [Candidatus Tumulicola sp.]|jgi:uncharacterized membrane protein